MDLKTETCCRPHNDLIMPLTLQGATPATIAVRNNTCCIGISSPELEDLAKAGEENRAQKCSTRELSLILAKNIILGEIDQRPIQWGGTFSW